MTDRAHTPDRTDPPRARDGDIAIRQEFQAATTTEELQLFVERHPGHPLTAEIRERLRVLDRPLPGSPFARASSSFGRESDFGSDAAMPMAALDIVGRSVFVIRTALALQARSESELT